eukprot:Skav221241  [mRNA]  locus=scaffold1045:119190:121017:+ [translate_table: standard]
MKPITSRWRSRLPDLKLQRTHSLPQTALFMMRCLAASWCFLLLPLLLAKKEPEEAIDWIAWVDNESQGPPSSGWQKIVRSERFQGFPWEQKQGKVNGRLERTS